MVRLIGQVGTLGPPPFSCFLRVFPFPLVGPPTGWAGLAASFGLAVQFLFSAKFVCMGNRPNRLTAGRAGSAYPGATLEPAGEGERTQTEADDRRTTQTNADKRPRPARGATPTLEPGTDLPYTSPRREGRKHNNQPKPNAPENPYAPPLGRMCWGNRGEVRLTLSRS